LYLDRATIRITDGIPNTSFVGHRPAFSVATRYGEESAVSRTGYTRRLPAFQPSADARIRKARWKIDARIRDRDDTPACASELPIRTCVAWKEYFRTIPTVHPATGVSKVSASSPVQDAVDLRPVFLNGANPDARNSKKLASRCGSSASHGSQNLVVEDAERWHAASLGLGHSPCA
jgi:hypothetical protein